MNVAIGEAKKAAEHGEIPVGAVYVDPEGHSTADFNRSVTQCDPSAHAEVVVLRRAATRLGNYRLGGTLYVTLEPCLMCMGALVQARIDRLVFAAADPKAGAAVSLYRIGDDVRLNHRFEVEQGPLSAEASELLQEFFRKRRSKRRSSKLAGL